MTIWKCATLLWTMVSDDIPNLWKMFEAGINYADNPSEVSKDEFIVFYDAVRKQLGVKWNLTVGLYWIRPFSYLNLDAPNRKYLTRDGGTYTENITKISSLKQLPYAKTYLDLIDACKNLFNQKENPQHSFPELSYYAWKASGSSDPIVKRSNASFLKWFVPIIGRVLHAGNHGR